MRIGDCFQGRWCGRRVSSAFFCIATPEYECSSDLFSLIFQLPFCCSLPITWRQSAPAVPPAPTVPPKHFVDFRLMNGLDREYSTAPVLKKATIKGVLCTKYSDSN